MSQPVPMVEIWRGPFLESMHTGHAVICDAAGGIIEAWGNPDQVVLSRSSSKMIQALPLIDSGAADAMGLTPQHLALACASHGGAPMHTQRVQAWLETLDLTDDALRCGAHMPYDPVTHDQMLIAGEKPCQRHNNCSGKHAGFLTLSKHLGGDSGYIDTDHPVQKAVLEAFERLTSETSPGFGIDGCSAPNFASSLHGMARAMARFAASPEDSAEARLHQAMRLHPELVAGENRACTDLMRATDGKVAIKTGAEGFFNVIIPEQKIGIALKITDGTTRASECAIAAILVKLGVLAPDHPATMKYVNAPILNRRGVTTGHMRAAPALL
ncbi:L-asparaginase [Roseobacter denitrificans]|uniref:L-asparaginase II n=1 Tax=Roseobacter denitrificans (strain ATCC 33942 / OCh 114) TaxID=375451 RepID=Q16DM0_ROSDO|nr:asparaginase [Roseobacter denitrificans]ABG29923.1 L-asparaginase II [Roseobacter denitrificans OCh 114]AVL53135.1 L-asparaginase [Roseobacter denitrificans]SFG38255.1 asparaginase [Roseobacter denitrificans OCh 114]